VLPYAVKTIAWVWSGVAAVSACAAK